MTDPFDTLAASHASRLYEALNAAIDDVQAQYDALAIQLAAVLDNADEESDGEHDWLSLLGMLGFDGETLEPLNAAIDDANQVLFAAIAGSLFVAAAARAASDTGHVLNGNDGVVRFARDAFVSQLLSRFASDSAAAIRTTAQRMLVGQGPAISRILQVVRVVGLTPAQAEALTVIRTALLSQRSFGPTKRDRLGRAIAPAPIDIAKALAPTRGRVSGPQRSMITKALNDALSEPAIEALLNKHARALRNHRLKVATGDMAHQATESGKLTGWQAAQRRGWLPFNQRRFWRTAGDERVRVAHAAVPLMNRLGVGLDAPFHTPLGDAFTTPLEVGCRCRVELRKP